jgi:hypothetical protein
MAQVKPPPVVREQTAVAASFGRTWDAVIDHFAERNISIRTMERSSGFIAAEPFRVREIGTRTLTRAHPTVSALNPAAGQRGRHRTAGLGRAAWVCVLPAIIGTPR